MTIRENIKFQIIICSLALKESTIPAASRSDVQESIDED